jgi:hypothetical protein
MPGSLYPILEGAIVAAVLVGVLLVIVPQVRSWRSPPPRNLPVTDLEITATRRARRYIRDHGSVVYVWADGGTLLRATTERPENVALEEVEASGFTAFIQPGLKLGEWLRIHRDAYPPWGLVPTWWNMDRSGV